MQRTFQATDRGKEVLDEEDTRVGTITGVSEETAYVRPAREVEELDAVDWTDDESSFVIETDRVERIDPASARLKSTTE